MKNFEDKFPILAKRKKMIEHKLITKEQMAIKRANREPRSKPEVKKTINSTYSPKYTLRKKCGCGGILRATQFGQHWCDRCKDFSKGAV